MADPARYRYMPDAGGRRSPPPYNPARASMPVTATGYSLYAGDLHAMSASHHEGMTRPSDDYPMSPVPSSSGAFSGRDKPVGRSTSVTDTARSHHRAVDHPNRPVIVTKHAGPVAALRSGSPSRDPYRASDEGPYYAEPASSIPRGRPPPLDDDDYRRLRERTHQDRLATRGPDTFRPPRPASLYAGGGASHRTGPHHTWPATILNMTAVPTEPVARASTATTVPPSASARNWPGLSICQRGVMGRHRQREAWIR
jgi:hypothetical protein